MEVIEFTFMGSPVPASRPRVTSNGTYTPKAYRDYKKALAAAIKKDYGFWAWDIPAPGSKERSKYLKNNRYALLLNVYRAVNKGDNDNFLKAVQDALQDAGVIADDSQIDESHVYKQMDKDNPRIEFILRRLKC